MHQLLSYNSAKEEVHLRIAYVENKTQNPMQHTEVTLLPPLNVFGLHYFMKFFM